MDFQERPGRNSTGFTQLQDSEVYAHFEPMVEHVDQNRIYAGEVRRATTERRNSAESSQFAGCAGCRVLPSRSSEKAIIKMEGNQPLVTGDFCGRASGTLNVVLQ